MKTIVVSTQKGGAGKTTLCANLGVLASRCAETYIIDTDPQATLSKWHKRREDETLKRADMPFRQIPAALKVLEREGAGFVFLDTPPTAAGSNAELFRLADLVLIPVKPSPLDVEATVPTIEAAKAARRPFMFVINSVKPNVALTAQTVATLSAFGTVLDVFVADRTAYAAAMVDGRAGVELMPKGPPAKEMGALWARIQDRLQA